MRPAKTAAIVCGALVALLGVALCVAGFALVVAHATQRDSAGYYTTSTEHFDTSTYALTSRVDLGDVPGERGWTVTHPAGTFRVRATPRGDRAIFVGIAPRSTVDGWLAATAHEEVRAANFGPFRVGRTLIRGAAAPGAPSAQTFWVASTQGTGTRSLRWPSESGHWAIVVMNVDGSRGVVADVSVGAKTGVLLPIGIGLGVLGLLALVVAGLLLYLGARQPARSTVESPPSTQPGLVPVPAPEPEPAPTRGDLYPARLDGRLDAGLSRWLWLVKFVLVIPHVIVLAFLWLAVTVMTVVAGFAVLFTGRYPRSIFDFNVGVMRWTWRVSFYGGSAFGTDRYPPFSLQPDPAYPATFDVDYPEHLSRGLVLVKWWLLAFPQYLIVAVFAGGWGIGWNGAWKLAGGGGLIALLAVIAAITLTVRGRYPTSIFDFVMGLNRWCYRVLVYVALMRDEYPPFRLDDGGTDPGSVPVLPPSPSPDSPDLPGELVETGS
jgi:hypothetical protein